MYFHKSAENGLTLNADVLVIGGGHAAAWAAWAAATRGAKVIVADKGYLGTSGALAASGSGASVVPPEKRARDKAKFERYAMGGYLANHEWMERVLDQTWKNMDRVTEWGYPFPRNSEKPHRRLLQAGEYGKLMRKVVKKAGVEILDQSPALELLLDAEGAVAGARGIQRQENRPWTVKAGAVIIATGGCAWLSKALGCNTNTGDGLLMAVEAGGELSGIEFSAHYSPAPVDCSTTKGAFMGWTTLTDESGKELDGIMKNGHRSTSAIAKELLKGRVFGKMDRGTKDPEVQRMIRLLLPNFATALDHSQIDPFTERFEITLVLEGTVRGTGGIRVVDETCSTGVPGLYAAGDAATRELNTGGFTGGAGPNVSWGIASGHWAGEAAADHARLLGEHSADRTVRGAGRTGLVSTANSSATYHANEIVKAVQGEIFPLDKNIFRTEKGLLESLAKLNQLWSEVQKNPEQGTPREIQRSREAVALLAAARWTYFAGLERKETRGMHKRLEYPQLDPNQRHYLITTGLDKLHVRREAVTEEIVSQPVEETAAVLV